MEAQIRLPQAVGQPRPLLDFVEAACLAEAENQGYEKPRSTSLQTGDRSAPLVVYALLMTISVGAAAWNAWMAVRNSWEIDQLRSRQCYRVASGGSSFNGGPLRDEYNGCTIDVTKVLGRAKELGYESVSNATLSVPAFAYAAVSGAGDVNSEKRPLVHLGSASFPSPAPDLHAKQVEKWNLDPRVGSIISGDISNGAGGLTINSTGYYYVYSQVGYVLSMRDFAEMSPATDHQLLRKSDKGESEVLARVQKTRCWSSKSNCSMASSYVGAVFLLRKGEVVAVEVDSAKYIWYSAQQTYLGAYLVSASS